MTGRTPEQMEADIAVQREQLAETVDQLSATLDVKAHARDAMSDVKHRATTDSGRPRPQLLAVVAGLVAAGAALVWWRRRG